MRLVTAADDAFIINSLYEDYDARSLGTLPDLLIRAPFLFSVHQDKWMQVILWRGHTAICRMQVIAKLCADVPYAGHNKSLQDKLSE